MLNRRERYNALKFLRICCNVGLLPLEVDLENWQLKARSAGKRWICFASYFCFLLHAMYKTGSLVYAYLFVPDAQLHQVIIHLITVMAAILVGFWYHVLYVRSPALFATFVNMTLLGNVGGTNLDQSDQLEKHWRARLREYSLQDLIATNLPYMAGAAVTFIVATYVYDPSMRLLLYAALPSHLQNWATFGLCLLEEIRYLLICVTTVGPLWQLQVITFDLVCSQLRRSIRKIENGTQSGRTVYIFLRCLQLYMSTFNNINSYLIFTWKLICIVLCIISGYAAIAHFQEHPIFGCMYYVLVVDGMLLYAVLYEKAFMIPELFDRTVRCTLLRMRGKRIGPFGRQMRSIPTTGVKVGNFHTMERASTLNFMNYVVVNIVNMLVAYG